jgi:fructose-specific phosphotransferase system IIC component
MRVLKTLRQGVSQLLPVVVGNTIEYLLSLSALSKPRSKSKKAELKVQVVSYHEGKAKHVERSPDLRGAP